VTDRLCVGGLGLLAAIFGLVAVLGLLAPHLLFDPIEVVIENPSGLAEIRAAYGSFFFASAGLFALGASRPHLRNTALLWAAVVLSGFVFGRLVSLGLDGVPNAVALGNLVAELIGAVAAFVLWYKRRKMCAQV
jgi:hypothetical protein